MVIVLFFLFFLLLLRVVLRFLFLRNLPSFVFFSLFLHPSELIAAFSRSRAPPSRVWRTAAELLFNVDGAYRVELAKVFKKYHRNVDASWLKSRPNNADWSLCLISLGRAAKTLPFFAKCALYRVHKDLTERGHRVYFGSV
jgi:hypothetical protein